MFHCKFAKIFHDENYVMVKTVDKVMKSKEKNFQLPQLQESYFGQIANQNALYLFTYMRILINSYTLDRPISTKLCNYVCIKSFHHYYKEIILTN